MSARRHRSALLYLLMVQPAGGALAAAAEHQGGWRGQATVTARTAEVDGSRGKYQQHINLDSGLHLQELVLHRDGRRRGPDRIRLSALQIGGEPDRRVTFEAREPGRYRVRLQHQRAEYVYDDVLVLPEQADPERSIGGDFHRFDFERRTTRAEARLELASRGGVDLALERQRRTGRSTTVLDVEREEFLMNRPVDDRHRLATLGADYRWERASLRLTESWRRHEDDVSVVLPGASEGFEPDAPSRLETFRLDQPFDYRSRERALQLDVWPAERSNLRLLAMRARLDGDHRFREAARGTSFTGAPFSRDERGSGDLSRDTDLIDLSAGHRLTDHLRLTARLRRLELDQRADSSVGDGAAIDWDIRRTAVHLGLEVAPRPEWLLGAGWIGEQRDHDSEDSARDTDFDGYFAHASWRPLPALNLRLSVEDSGIDAPLASSSPTDRRRYRLRARYRGPAGWWLSASHERTELDNDASDWKARDRQTSARLGYRHDALELWLGVARLEVDREIRQPVVSPVLSVVFPIDYDSDTVMVDASASWQVTPRIGFGGSLRRYRNDGSFDIDRDDYRVWGALELGRGYGVTLSYRNTELDEAALDGFEADIVELSLRRRW